MFASFTHEDRVVPVSVLLRTWWNSTIEMADLLFGIEYFFQDFHDIHFIFQVMTMEKFSKNSPKTKLSLVSL